MGLIKKRKLLSRELMLMKATLRTGLKYDVSDTATGKILKKKGLLTKKGKTSAKGRKAIRLL